MTRSNATGYTLCSRYVYAKHTLCDIQIFTSNESEKPNEKNCDDLKKPFGLHGIYKIYSSKHCSLRLCEQSATNI